jgi:hypothetical protein
MASPCSDYRSKSPTRRTKWPTCCIKLPLRWSKSVLRRSWASQISAINRPIWNKSCAIRNNPLAPDPALRVLEQIIRMLEQVVRVSE